jgi:hypothetical protein
MVQRKAARFITGNWSREEGTVTSILEELKWSSLEERRKIQRLVLLYKAINGEVALEIPSYVEKKSAHTRNNHGDRYIEVTTKIDPYKYSYFPRTIADWNQLPLDATSASSSASFKTSIPKA